MIKVRIVTLAEPPAKLLGEIPNGTFFTGTIDGYVSQGPFLKVGSVTERFWCVVKVESMEGAVWVSSRVKDQRATIVNYQPIDVREVVLLDRAQPDSAPAVPNRSENPTCPRAHNDSSDSSSRPSSLGIGS